MAAPILKTKNDIHDTTGGMAQIPVLTEPHDTLRDGFVNFKAAAGPAHPVEAIQKTIQEVQEPMSNVMMAVTYGSALPMTLQMERQILGSLQRRPGLPNSHTGLDTMTGKDLTIDFEDWLGFPGEREEAPPAIHDVMEARYGLTKRTTAQFGAKAMR